MYNEGGKNGGGGLTERDRLLKEGDLRPRE